MVLCNVCENLQYDVLNKGFDEGGFPGHPFHQNYTELVACLNCDFCNAIVNDIASDTYTMNRLATWRDQQMYLRLFPSGMPPDESDSSNLLVYSSPHKDGGAHDQTTLTTYGLFLERTNFEFNEGKP